MTKLFKLAALLLPLVVWMSACDDTGGDPYDPIGLEIQEAPETMLANIDSIYTIRCRVADEGVNPEYILCEVTPPGGGTLESFQLYDDGSSTVLPAHPYAGDTSGDIVPNNDSYTRTLNGRLLAAETGGNYLFTFSIPGQTSSIYSKQITVQAANIEDCIIEQITEIDGLNGCYDPFEIVAVYNVAEPDSITDAYGILLHEGVPIDTLEFTPWIILPSQTTDGTSDWACVITPSSFPCAGTDDNYSFRYEVTTRYGMTCNSVTADFSILNDPQEILNLVGLPDTLLRPDTVGDTSVVVVSLDLDDCNLRGVLGFTGVRFDLKVDNGDFAHDTSYMLNDDGALGDTTAGDSTYSVGLAFWISEDHLDNLYIFRYYSVECAYPNDSTDYLYDTVRVIQPVPPIPLDYTPSNHDLGFGVLSPSTTGGSR